MWWQIFISWYSACCDVVGWVLQLLLVLFWIQQLSFIHTLPPSRKYRMMSDAVGSSSVEITVPVVPQFFEVWVIACSLTPDIYDSYIWYSHITTKTLQDSGMKTYHNAVDPTGYDIQGDSMQVELNIAANHLCELVELQPLMYQYWLFRSSPYPSPPAKRFRPSPVWWFWR